MAITAFDDKQLRFELEGFNELEQDEQISAEQARLISEAARATLEGRAELPDWFADYLKLLEQGWPWRVATYIAWASSPRHERWPGTLRELATEVLGLTTARVVHKWRRDNPTIDQVVAMMQAAPLWEHRRDVLEALVEIAMRPDYKSFNDRKLFLEMIGDYTPRSRLDVGKAGKNDDLSELTEAELLKMAGEIEAEDDAGDADAD